MPIILPEFKGRKCQEATFCGYILKSDYTSELPFKAVDRSLIADYERSDEKVRVRLAPPFPYDDDRDLHVHVDFSPANRKGLSKPNATIDDVLARLEPFIGHKLHLTLSGVFRVARLPPLIRPTQAEYSVGDALTVRMTSGTLAVRGNAPIQKIAWALLENGGASIELETRTTKTLEESYLVNGLELLEAAFEAMFVEKGSEQSAQ
jgi:hypothetical protein